MPPQLLQVIDRRPADDPPDLQALRIAVATHDLKSANAHFGSARRFAVYDVTARTSRFVQAHAFGEVSDETGDHPAGGDDAIGRKVQALSGCNLLFVLAIGGPAAARVVGARIHPVKLPAPESIDGIIARLQTMMRDNPPPWLRKAMAAQRGRPATFAGEAGRA